MPSSEADYEQAIIMLMAMATMAAEWIDQNGTPPQLSPTPIEPEEIMVDAMQALLVLGVPTETLAMLIGRATIGAL